MAKSNCPIYSKVINFVLPKVTPEAKRALEQSLKVTTLETDAFPRSGNFTAYTLDELARSSAKAEKRLDAPGEWAFTYSTMQGRRVDDIIYVALWHASSFVFPPTPREDKKKDGTPKMQTHDSQREKWIISLGFERKEIKNGEKVLGRRTLFGDAFQDLKDELEKLIPQRFEGTEKPASTKKLINLIAPARLSSVTMRYNAYLKDAGAEKVLFCVKELTLFVLDGWSFEQDDAGVIKGELAAFYADEIEKYIPVLKAEMERADAKAEEAKAAA